MEIPFKNTNDKFEDELKKALGFVDSDLPYLKLKPDLNLAANYLVSLIGKTTYDALIANYKLNVEGADGATARYRDEPLNDAFQYAIASYAYMLFAPANDIAHTANGRRMRSSSSEKTPFEWMIVKDDDNLKKRAFKAIDSLIKYMDSNFDTWKESDAFKATHKFYVRTLEDFSSAYVLESRLLLIKLVPGLSNCEKREIIPRIGSELNQTLKEKIIYKASGATGDSSKALSDDESLLIDYIKEACAYYALHWAFPRLQVQMFPEGILQAVRSETTSIKGRTVPQVPVIDQASKLFKADADRVFLSIENHIKKMFPPEEVEQTQLEADADEYGFNEDDNFIST